MLRPILSRRTAVLAAVAALAVAAGVGAYFAAQIGDGTTVAQEAEQGKPAATPTAPAVVKPSVTPLPMSPTPPAPTPLPTTTATPAPPLTATATPTTPPATPEPTPEPGGDGSGTKPPHVEPPPSAMLVTASGEQSAGACNYCWKGLCVDMLGVIVPADAVIAGAGEPVTFKLAVEPTQLELLVWTLDSGKVVKDYEGSFAWRAQGEPSFEYQLPAQSSFQFTPDFPPGRYVIVLYVRASPGDASYGFLLELAP